MTRILMLTAEAFMDRTGYWFRYRMGLVVGLLVLAGAARAQSLDFAIALGGSSFDEGGVLP